MGAARDEADTLRDRGHLRRRDGPRPRALRAPPPAPSARARRRAPARRQVPRGSAIGVRGQPEAARRQGFDRGQLERDFRPVCTHHLRPRQAFQLHGSWLKKPNVGRGIQFCR